RRNWADAIGSDAARAASGTFARAGFRDPTLILRWEEIAGAEVARIARPFRLNEGPNGAVLTLKAEPGAAVFLQHESRALCGRINAYLGRDAIARLKFVQGAISQRPKRTPPKRPAAAIPPGDPVLKYNGPKSLQEALLSLAKSRAG
ncbi:MAG TPA: DciA family protein, partial [Rhizomicrobium sp.]